MDVSQRDDLRAVYMQTFTGFAVDAGDVVQEHEHINSRYARELLGVLTTHGLLTTSDVNGDDIVWQVIKPGTSDDHDIADAEHTIDEFLDQFLPTNPTPSKETTVTKTATKKAAASPATAKAEKAIEFKKCRCGCGADVPKKSNYRPGHDARHAGDVARAIAAGGNADTLLETLPSERLQVKAQDMAIRLSEKASKKAETKVAKTEPTPGKVTVRKVEREAFQDAAGAVSYKNAKGELTPASDAIAKTFVAA